MCFIIIFNANCQSRASFKTTPSQTLVHFFLLLSMEQHAPRWESAPLAWTAHSTLLNHIEKQSTSLLPHERASYITDSGPVNIVDSFTHSSSEEKQVLVVEWKR